MAGRALPRDPERGRGGYSGKSILRAGMAPNSGKENPLESHLSSASHFGKLFWQAIPASQFGGVLLQVNLADHSAGF
jgi:hypothetical protein